MSTAATQYLDPAILARLEGLALRARLIVEGYVSGVHRSPFHGFSIEFAEHREYTPGDDLRYLDWKVFGRSDRYCLKQFEEETNLVCHLLLDTSESMTYESSQAAMSKLEYAKCAAASLAYLILHQQDSVGLVTFDREVRALVRPGSNPSHMKELLHVMESAPGGRKTAAGPILHDLAERFKKRGIVIVFSDLLDDVDAILAGLKHFRHRRHEVVLFHVLDPAEVDFPFDEMTLFRGLEGLPELVAEPRALRRAYLDELSKFTHRLKQGCRQQRIDYVLVRTDQSLEVVLSSYLASRR
jgi:uncharacterized protein (DUF58 family)